MVLPQTSILSFKFGTFNVILILPFKDFWSTGWLKFIYIGLESPFSLLGNEYEYVSKFKYVNGLIVVNDFIISLGIPI